jgi:GTP cyclohydrolase I
MENLIRELLVQLGENPDREGLVDTPARVARSLQFLTSGYHVDSLCEHHMLPFFGRCHIGYIPKGEVFGVSKLCRIVECFSRRLQLQERLTQQVARLIADSIHPEGVGVVMEAKHLCMMMRGVEKQDSCMVTSAMLGSFHDSHATRNEFLQLINRPSVA